MAMMTQLGASLPPYGGDVATAATAIGFSMRLIDRFSRESPANIADSPESTANIVDSPESMEEALLQSRALTEAENELSDDEPGSQIRLNLDGLR